MRKLIFILATILGLCTAAIAGGSTAPATVTNVPGLQAQLDRDAIVKGGLDIASNNLNAWLAGQKSNHTDTSLMERCKWTAMVPCTDLVPVFEGWYPGGSGNLFDLAAPNSYTVTAAIEYPSGTYWQLTFNGGSLSATVNPWAIVYPDPAPVTITGPLFGTVIDSGSTTGVIDSNLTTGQVCNNGDYVVWLTGQNANLIGSPNLSSSVFPNYAPINFATLSTGKLTMAGTMAFAPAMGDTFEVFHNFWVRAYITIPATSYYIINHFPGTFGNEGVINNGGVDDTVTTATITGGSGFMDAWAVLGRAPAHNVSAISVVGDSIFSTSVDLFPMEGVVSRALVYNHPVIMDCIPSYTAAGYATTTSNVAGCRMRALNLNYTNYMICQLGINDVFANTSALGIEEAQMAVWQSGWQHGNRVFQTTLPPSTTSTDGWRTTTNQTVSTTAQNTARVAVNDWIRAGAPVSGTTGLPVVAGTAGSLPNPYLYGYIELANSVESAQDSGVWKAATSTPVTGKIGTVSATSTTLTDSGASWTTNQWAGYEIGIDTGTGAGQGRMIGSNTATTITIGSSTFFPTWTTTPDSTSNFHISAAYTQDGTHGTAAVGIPVLAAALNSAVNAQMPAYRCLYHSTPTDWVETGAVKTRCVPATTFNRSSLRFNKDRALSQAW